ncbi:MAG: hypothetical protein HY517_04960 [Candidatus Aenigmarchaeota archaeon]|nr:hypothetical protein [Candidatus Aenigmarchaeota archaeon]
MRRFWTKELVETREENVAGVIFRAERYRLYARGHVGFLDKFSYEFPDGRRGININPQTTFEEYQSESLKKQSQGVN